MNYTITKIPGRKKWASLKHKWKQKRLCVWVGGQGLEGKGGMHERHCTLEKKNFIVAGQRKSARGRLTVYDPETGCERAGATGPVNVQRWGGSGMSMMQHDYCKGRRFAFFLRGMSFFSFCFCACAFFFVHLLCVFVYLCLLITAFLDLFFLFLFLISH